MTVDDLLEALAELKRQRPSAGMDLVEFRIDNACGPGGVEVGTLYGDPSEIEAVYGSVTLVDARNAD